MPLSGLGVPGVYLTDMLLMAAVTYLFVRRLYIPQIRYISLPADYFPLFLDPCFGNNRHPDAIPYQGRCYGGERTGHGSVYIQPESSGWNRGNFLYPSFHPVCVLIAYFPFSKLMHLAGIFLSPTRNLANNSRFVRHVNPWNYAVKSHTYEAYEDEFRENMIEAGYPG